MKTIIKYLFIQVAFLLISSESISQSLPDSCEAVPFLQTNISDGKVQIEKKVYAERGGEIDPAEPPTTVLRDGTDANVFPSHYTQASPSISINKQNPDQISIVSEVYTNNFKLGNFYSHDGGLTWNGVENWDNDNWGGYEYPRNDVNNSNRFYRSASNISLNTIQSSTNGGVSWGQGPYITIHFQYTPEATNIAVDKDPNSPYSNNVYAAWGMENNISGKQLLFSRSTDNGQSFTTPVVVKNGPGFGIDVQTGPNGEIYTCWSDRSISDPTFPYKGTGFSYSTNGGTTFSQPVRIMSYTGIRSYFGQDATFNNTIVYGSPTMAVDKSTGTRRGRIYIANNLRENGNGKSIIQVSYSDNQGNSWSSPVTVNIPNGRQNWSSKITVDDCSGDVWVVYYSLDNISGFSTNTYVAYSSDGGTNWTNQKVSDVSHITAPFNNNIFPAGHSGRYIGITAYNKKAYAVWSDNRTGIWQLYCSKISAGICTPPASLWPKTYQIWDNVYNNSGNSHIFSGANSKIYFTTSSTNLQNNINHGGTIPANTNSNFLIEYSSNGIANFTRDQLTENSDVFVFNNGSIRTKISSISSQYIHIDPSNNAIITAPAYIPNDERVLAETITGSVITYKNGIIYFRTLSTVNSISCALKRSFFNATTNKLYVDGNNGTIKIFELQGNNIVLLNTLTIPYNAFNDFALYHVDNQNNLYFLYMKEALNPLYKWNSANNSVIPVSMPGFTNQSIAALKYGGSLSTAYTSDKCLIANPGVQKLQVLDFSLNTIKGVSASGYCFFPSTSSAPAYSGCSYSIVGSTVYLSGWTSNQPNSNIATVGNQTVNNISMNGASSFVIKLNLLGDFNRTTDTESITKNSKTSSKISINIFPNPVRNFLNLSITDKSIGKESSDNYKVTITDKMGNIRLSKLINSRKLTFDISHLQQGVYHITVSNNTDFITQSFIKE